MYNKCGCTRDARAVFDDMLQRDVVIWTSLILGYVENGESLKALNLFRSMDCEPDRPAFVAALKACAKLASESSSNAQFCLETGMAIQRQTNVRGLDGDVVVGNTLVHMYSKCGSMRDARAVFDSMIHRSPASWTSLIMGYVENGESIEAMEMFIAMDCQPDSRTLVAALRACRRSSLEKGMAIHKQAIEHGFHTDMFVATSLVEMYSKCGSMEDAQAVFNGVTRPDVVLWTSLILGYVENKESVLALEAFWSMDCEPDCTTVVAALKACAGLESDRQFCLENGMAIHRQAKERGFDRGTMVANSLVHMYSKCGSMQDARSVLENMDNPTVVSWTSLIMGYVENGESLVAMELFTNMDCEPSGVTYVAALKSCSNLGALAVGEGIHAQICKLGLEDDRVVTNSLVEFYTKCCRMTGAEYVFVTSSFPDIVSWTCLIEGYSSLGNASRVFSLVRDMKEGDLELDGVVLLSIFKACSHAGMVEHGRECFKYMLEYGIPPTVEHYTCMVDMFARANRLEEAFSIIENMPFEADSFVWTSLLAACKSLNNLELGKVAFDALGDNSPAYVLMSDMYRKME